MKKLILVLLIGSSLGCATTGRYKQTLTTWVGRDMQEFINSWGYPTKQLTVPNGNTVYIYEYSQNVHFPQFNVVGSQNATVVGNHVISSGSENTVAGGISGTRWCFTYIEVNKSNNIVNWNWKGNDCKL